MRTSINHSLEMILGAVLLMLGLIYLVAQEKALNRLIDIVNASMLETDDLYQQSNDVDANCINSDALNAIVMGYRGYPISIDGTRIEDDGTEYEYYFSLIRSGFYVKSYTMDENHNILQVNYTYTGS